MLLGGFALILSSSWLITSLPLEFEWKPYVLLILGILTFMVGAWSIRNGQTPKIITSLLEKSSTRLGIYPNQVVFVLLSIPLAVTAAFASGDRWKMWNLNLAVAAWLLSMTLAILGVWRKEEKLPRISKPALSWAVAFFVISAILRGIFADKIPMLLNGDEASAGLSSVQFVEGRVDNVFGVGFFSFPALFFYLQSISIRLLGQTTLALRLPSAIAGGLTVAAVYLVGRRVFNRQTGLLAAIFMTGFHFHIHFSRIGLNNIWDGLWFVVVLGMLWDGWQHKRRSSYLIAGFALGISQYFYVTVRMLPVLVLLWLGIAILFNRENLKEQKGNILTMLFVAIIIALPLAWFYILHPLDFMAPYNRVTVLGEWLENEVIIKGMPAWQILMNQLEGSARLFLDRPVTMWYNPGTPSLRPNALGLFLAGLSLLVLKLRDSRTHLLLIWVAAFVATGALSLPTSAAQRYVAVAPACAFIVGFSLSELSRSLSIIWSERIKLFNIVSIIIILLVSADDMRFYFFEYGPASDSHNLNTLVAQRLAEYLQTKEKLEVAFFGSPRMGYYSISSLPYLAPHIHGNNFLFPWGEEGNPVLVGNHFLFVFLPNHGDNLISVMSSYPEGDLWEEYDRDGNLLYYYFDVMQ